MYRVFVVEDDDKIASILVQKMEQYGYTAKRATQFRELIAELEAFDPQLVLLDVNLPYFDGFYWCRQIRMRSSMPIIYLSARAGEMDQVMAIENGGDDYLTKPIQLELLMAKVRGALRRAYGEYAGGAEGAISGKAEEGNSGSNSAGAVGGWGLNDDNRDGARHARELTSHTVIDANGIRLHISRNELEWREARVELTKNECLLAECFMRRPGLVAPRELLLEALWDDVQFVDDNTLTVNVTRLRKKLDDLGLHKAIETIRGQGYKWIAGDAT
ncbi:response regulator transcription factor [Paenibacillus sp. HB172176]|uniref:response regulator transcription factor n=1 Tax=Paenibacillus sp. HB172176 TaxID=2493690 RepID=UPI001F0D132D|nr:response regulator transcription factor [Paenibacillus sp. HB172176]